MCLFFKYLWVVLGFGSILGSRQAFAVKYEGAAIGRDACVALHVGARCAEVQNVSCLLASFLYIFVYTTWRAPIPGADLSRRIGLLL